MRDCHEIAHFLQKLCTLTLACVIRTIEMEQSGELDSWVDVLSSESKIIS